MSFKTIAASISPSIVSLARRVKTTLTYGFAGLAIALAAHGSAHATIWMQSNAVESLLSGNPVAEANGNTWTIKYTDQVATNVGPAAGQFAMYLAWNWVYDTDGNTAALQGNSSTPTFTAPGVATLSVSRPGFTDQSIRIGDVVGDTWIGVPYQAYFPDPFITTQADWIAPLIDFGFMAAGAQVLYDITLSFEYASVEEFERSGQFYVEAQGLQAVPEPGSLALVGVGLVGLVALRSRVRGKV